MVVVWKLVRILIFFVTAARVIIVFVFIRISHGTRCRLSFVLIALLFCEGGRDWWEDGSLEAVVSAAFLLVDDSLSHLVISSKVRRAPTIGGSGIQISHSALHETDSDGSVPALDCSMEWGVAADRVVGSLVHVGPCILHQILDHGQVALLSGNQKWTCAIFFCLVLVDSVLQQTLDHW